MTMGDVVWTPDNKRIASYALLASKLSQTNCHPHSQKERERMKEYCNKCSKEIFTSSTNANQLCPECSLGIYKMEVKMETKFKVGEAVRVKYEKGTKFFIHEVMTQQCPGGTQIHYTGRVFSTKKYASGVDVKQLTRFNEVELEAIPEPLPGLKILQDKLLQVKTEKENCIKTQDFEKAVEFRNEEKKIKMQIELFDED